MGRFILVLFLDPGSAQSQAGEILGNGRWLWVVFRAPSSPNIPWFCDPWIHREGVPVSSSPQGFSAPCPVGMELHSFSGSSSPGKKKGFPGNLHGNSCTSVCPEQGLALPSQLPLELEPARGERVPQSSAGVQGGGPGVPQSSAGVQGGGPGG